MCGYHIDILADYPQHGSIVGGAGRCNNNRVTGVLLVDEQGLLFTVCQPVAVYLGRVLTPLQYKPGYCMACTLHRGYWSDHHVSLAPSWHVMFVLMARLSRVMSLAIVFTVRYICALSSAASHDFCSTISSREVSCSQA